MTDYYSEFTCFSEMMLVFKLFVFIREHLCRLEAATFGIRGVFRFLLQGRMR